MNLRASFDGKNLIKKCEGLRLQAYKCAAGVWTIGYGHTGNVKEGDVITQSKADELLAADLVRFESAVNSELQNITQNQFDALVSFAFNVGVNAFKTSTLLKKAKLNPADNSIRNEFLKWVNAGGRPLDGLKKRREQEAELYFR
jgi:lysozyme